MLLQFTVENYKSFKECAVLSLEASKDDELEDNLTTIGKYRVLNSVTVFGANAAGKSNLFMALTTAIMIVRDSSNQAYNNTLDRIVPFKFDREYQNRPTSFEFTFIADNTKYVYGFSATRRTVVQEYLYVYRTSKASVVFERTEVNNYRFTSAKIKKELAPVIERNTDNKLFLATATTWNCESTRIPYLWFAESINTYTNDSEKLLPLVLPMFDSEDNGLRAFTLRLLHEADINISDYTYESHEMSGEEAREHFPKELQNLVSTMPITNKAVRINTIHTIERDGFPEEQFPMAFRDESKGTQSLFMMSPILKRVFETGETLCVDEFDASIHPLLNIYLVKLFGNPEINKGHAQLIISVQSTELLSLSILRRDQIYFVEKKRKTGESELYSLDEFSPRKNEDVRKAYLYRKFGSVPNVPDEAELWG